MSLAPQMKATRKQLQDKNNDHKAAFEVEDDEDVVRAGRKPIFRRRWTILDKRSFGALLIVHLLCLIAPFQFTWPAFWIAFLLHIITYMLGLSLSYHRHLSHKSFKLPKWLEYTFAYFGVHLLQGDPIDWVSTHKYHHQFVDTERDPHSPTQGFWFAYIIWIFDSYDLTKKVSGKEVEDFEEMEQKQKSLNNIFGGFMKYGKSKNVEDLQKQAFYRFLRTTYLLHHLALALVLYVVGGLPFLVWGMVGGFINIWRGMA